MNQDSQGPPRDRTRPEAGRTRAVGTSGLRAFPLACLLLVVCLLLGFTAQGDSDEREKNHSLQGEELDRLVAREQAREDKRKRERETPEAKADRRRSRTAYKDQKPHDAHELARAKFEEVFADRLWKGWKVGPGERILRTVGDSAFVVDKPNGPNLLVKSFEPLLAEDASGRKDRVDTGLRDDGAALETSHTPAGARIGERAHEGVRLPRSGIGIRLQGANPESEARVEQDKAFFANARPDADLAVAAFPRGVEAMIHIRSEDGPEESVLEFELPEGAKLEEREGAWPMAGVEITRDGKQIGTVSAPQTQDAEGETVPTTFDVRGNEMVIRVDHRGGDFRYPLLVDPYAQETFYWQSGTSGMRNWWFWETQAEFQPYCNMDFNCPATQPPVPFGGAGLWSRAPNRDNWGGAAKGAWVWKAPEDVSIAVFNVHGWGHKQSASWFFAWISDPDNPFQWDQTSGNSGLPSGSNALMLDGTNTEAAQGEHQLCVGQNPCTPEADWKNSAVFGLVMLASSNMGLQDGWATLQRPRLELWENQRPQIVSLSPAAPTSWIHSTPANFLVNVTDRGLGAWKVAVRGVGGAVQTSTDNCDGTIYGASCHDTQFPPLGRFVEETGASKYTYGSPPEGTTRYGRYVQDYVGNPSTGQCNPNCIPTFESEWDLRIDRSAPNATNPTGILGPPGSTGAAPRGWVKEGSHVLELRPTDAYSGIKQSEVEVKPGPIVWDVFGRTVSGGWGNAPQGGAWSLSGTASAFNVNGDRGTMNSPQNQARMAFLGSTNSQNVDVKADVAFPNTPPAGGVEHGQLLLRRTSDATHSRIGIERGTDNKLYVTGTNGAGAALFPRTDTGLTFVNDHVYSVRARVNGTSVKVRVWDRAAEEPTTWNIDATDSAIGPQGSGAVGLRAVSTAPAGATIGFDNLVAVDLSNFKAVSSKVENCDANGCASPQPVNTHTWGTAGYPDGTWQFRGVARDPLAYGTDNPGSHVRTDSDWSVKFDRSRPVIESANLVGSRWVRPGGSHDVDVDTKDDLSGVDWIRLYVNSDPVAVDSERGDCPSEVCTLNPAAKRLTWNVPANYTASTATLKIVAEDVATNKSFETTRTVYVDDDKPSATISGPLRNARNRAVRGNSFAVTVNGSDGDASNPSSGIDKMQGFAGPSIGNLTERFNGTATGCGPDNCAYTFNSSFGPTAADETRSPRRLHVRVSDRVGLGSDDPPAYPSRVSQWRLNETSATQQARDSIGPYHGTYVNSPAVNQPGATTDGDKSVRFNGSNTRVDLPNVLSAAGSFTIEGWVKLDAAGQDPAIVSQRDGTGMGRSLLFVASSTGRFSSNLGGITRDSGVTAEIGRWYHVAFSYAGGANAPWAFYVNGARTATGTATGESANGNWVIGANKVSACNWNGQIDDVSVYSTALGAAEVGRLAGTDPTDSRTAHWHLGEVPLVDPFDTLDAWTFDFGANTLDASNGQLVASDSSEKVLRSDGNYTDVQGTMAFRTGSTMPGSAIGLVFRRRDANNWVHGFVNPTGALSFWKKDNGTWSALSTQSRPVLAPNTNYWIRAEARGNVLTAWLYTADPAGGATPVTTVTHTLTGADATKFGAGVSAPAGFRIQGAPIDYRYDSVRLDPLTAKAAVGSDHGTYTGKVTLNQTGAPADGGQVPLFEGGFVDVGNPASLQLSEGTVEAWIKASSPGAGHRGIVTKRLAYGLFLENGVLVTYDWGGNANRSTGVNLADGQWHHVAMTFRSGVANGTVLYVDGTPRLTTQLTVSGQGHPIHIASEAAQTNTFLGSIDEPAVYPAVLSAAEVKRLYDGNVYDWKVVFDNGLPALDEPSPPPPNGWVNSLDSLRTTLRAQDPVSGIKRFKLIKPTVGGTEEQTHTFDDCFDHIDHLCATDRRRTFTYGVGLMPDGQSQTVKAVAEDAVGNVSAERTWTLRVDNTRPTVDSKAGELAQDGKWVRPGQTYSLTADTSDNLSGVERIDFKVNGAVVQSQPGDNCTSNGCDVNPPAKPFQWTVPDPYDGPGTPTLQLVAVDAAGNESLATTWTVRIDEAAPPMPTLSGSLWDVRGTATNGSNFGLDVVATDTVEGAGGSGVKQIKLLVAPETRAAAEGPPDERGASPPQSTPANAPQSHHFDFSPLSSDESRTPRNVIVQVEDQAGHKAQFPWKVIFDREVPQVAEPVDVNHAGSWWYNELEAPTLSVSATDSISGINQLALVVPQQSGGPYTPFTNFGCGNVIPPQCTSPRSTSLTFATATMPEGEVMVSGAASDPAGNVGLNGQKRVNVDKSKPQLQSKSGPIAQDTAWVREGTHNLTLNWSDAYSGMLASAIDIQRPPMIADSFERSSSSGWGQADLGGAWTEVAGSPGEFTVGSGRGTIAATSTAQRTAVLGSTPAELFDATVRVRMPDTLPTSGQVLGGIIFRNPSDNRNVRGLLRIETSGLLRVQLISETFSSMAAINFNWTPGAEINLRLRRTQAGAGIVVTAWRPADPEPTSGAQGGYVAGSESYVFAGQGQLGLTATNVGTGTRAIGFDDFQVRAPSSDGQSTTSNNCGRPGCPATLTHSFDWSSSGQPEGIHTVRATGHDAVSHPSDVAPWRFGLDRGNPDLTLSGLLKDLEGQPIYGGIFPLHMKATDGSLANDTTRRSGAERLELWVDRQQPGEPPDWSRFQECNPDSCTMEDDYVFLVSQYPPGEHTVTVRATDGVGHTTEQEVTVLIATPAQGLSDKLGLEEYFTYDSTETGGGSAAHVNVATGNVVWHSVPMVSPGRGLSTVVNLTYNSQTRLDDTVLPYRTVGRGFSLGISGLTRVNEPLDVTAANAGLITLTDPDGTRHRFVTRNGVAFEPPPGVNLHLRRFAISAGPVPLPGTDPERIWGATRPDGVTYFFDARGWLEVIEDRNGNKLDYVYEYRDLLSDEPCDLPTPAELDPLTQQLVCRKLLSRVVDPGGREYELAYHPGDLIDAVFGNRLKSIEDHAGRVSEFTYETDPLRRDYLKGFKQGIQSAGWPAERTFDFEYEDALDPEQTGPDALLNRKLKWVEDPEDQRTHFGYTPVTGSPPGETDVITGRSVAFVQDRTDSASQRTTYDYAPGTDCPADRDCTRVTDPLGRTARYELDDEARMRERTDAVATVSEFEWDDDNNLTLIRQAADTPDETETEMTYNPNGLLVSHIDPNDNETKFAYRNGPGTIVSQVPLADTNGVFVSDPESYDTPRNHRWLFTVDAKGNVTKQTDPLGNEADTVYDLQGQITEEVDFHEPGQTGNKTTYFDFHPSGQPGRMVDSRGNGGEPAAEHTWFFCHDAAGNLVQMTDPRGATPGPPCAARSQFTTRLIYDNRDRLRFEFRPFDSRNGSDSVRSFEYDDNDNIVKEVDGEWQEMNREFTAMDLLRDERSPAVRHWDPSNIERLGPWEQEVTHLEYDVADRITRADSPLGEGANGAHHSTSMTYDAVDRPIVERRKSRGGNPWEEPAELVTSYAYDRRGNVVGLTDPNRNAAGGDPVENAATEAKRRFTVQYDAGNRIIARIEGPGQAGLGIRTAFFYDKAGNLTEEQDPRGNSIRSEYDARELLTDRYDQRNRHTKIEYRADGRPVKETAPRGMATTGIDDDFQAKYTYFPTGELKSYTFPRDTGSSDAYASKEFTVHYRRRNAVGDPELIEDARGETFENTFLDTGEVRTTERPSWWRWDGSGLRQRMPSDLNKGDMGGGMPSEDGQGDGGRVESEPMPGIVPRKGFTTFGYDKERRLETVEDVEHKVTRLPRDEMGRIEKIDQPFGAPDADRIVTRNFYDRNGNLQHVIDGRGSGTTMTYDDYDRLVRRAEPGQAEGASELTTFKLDANGNRRFTVTPALTEWEQRYDGIDRVTHSIDPLGHARRLGYDSNGNEILMRSPFGNALGEDDNSENDCPKGEPGELTDPDCFEVRREFTPANELERETDGHGNTTEYDYDENGNLKMVDASGSRPGEGADVERQVIFHRHDGRDLPWSTTTGLKPDGTPGTTQVRTTVTELDGNGNLRRTVNPAGVGSDRTPNEDDGGPADTQASDSGDRDALRSPTKNAAVNEYDENDLLTATLLPWGDGDTDVNGSAVEDEKRHRQDYTLNPRGWTRVATEPYEWKASGSDPEDETTYDYFDSGWIERSTETPRDGLPEKSEYKYDEQGNQREWKLFGTGGAGTRTVTREYFPNGMLKKRTGTASGGGGTEAGTRSYTYEYTDNRRVNRIVDNQLHRVTEVRYDGAERETAVNEFYNGTGTRYWNKDTRTRYDANGNVTSRRTDGEWNPTGDDYSGGKVTEYQHDALNREVTTHVHNAGAADTTDRFFDATYFASGQRQERRRYRGAPPAFGQPRNSGLRATESFFFESDGRLRNRRRESASEDQTTTYDYAYDKNGNRTEDLRHVETTGQASRDDNNTYGFNSRDQVTRWTREKKQGGNTTLRATVRYKLDGSGQVKDKDEEQSVGGNRSQTSTYVHSGQRLDSETVSEGCSQTQSFSYSGFGEVSGVSSNNGTCPATRARPPRTLSYDPFGRPSRVVEDGRRHVRYSYDGLDRRTFKCQGGATEPADDAGTEQDECTAGRRVELSYVGMSERLSAEHDEDDLPTSERERSYDYSSTLEPLGLQSRRQVANPLEENPSYRSFITGPNGSVEGLEGDNGRVADNETYHYDPYGAPMRRDGQMSSSPNDPTPQLGDPTEDELSSFAQDNPLRFQGQYFDTGIKTYDTPSRPYAPEVGRFLTQDRYESSRADFSLTTDPLTQNRYVFAGGNPINFVDWDGHEPSDSYTDGCDSTYGSPWRCRKEAREGPRGRARYRRAQRYRRQWRYAQHYSTNWPEGRARVRHHLQHKAIDPDSVKNTTNTPRRGSEDDGNFIEDFKDGLKDAAEDVKDWAWNPERDGALIQGIRCGIGEEDQCDYSGEYGDVFGRGTFYGSLFNPEGSGGTLRGPKPKPAGPGGKPPGAKPGKPEGPGTPRRENEGMSERSAKYQEQVTGTPRGQVYDVNGVKFDGYRDGVLQEAKGPGYAKHVENGEFKPYFSGAEGMVKQARSQIAAAGGTPIQWTVAEGPAATAIQNLFRRRGISGVQVRHVPPG